MHMLTTTMLLQCARLASRGPAFIQDNTISGAAPLLVMKPPPNTGSQTLHEG